MTHELYYPKYKKNAWVRITRLKHQGIFSNGTAGLDNAEIYDSGQPGAEAREALRQRLYIEAWGVSRYATDEILYGLAGSDLYR